MWEIVSKFVAFLENLNFKTEFSNDACVLDIFIEKRVILRHEISLK